jgi:hypothetical protein
MWYIDEIKLRYKFLCKSNFKGTVRRKLMWVKSGINRKTFF